MKNLKNTAGNLLVFIILTASLVTACSFIFSCSGEESQAASLKISETSVQSESSLQSTTVAQTIPVKNEIQNISVEDTAVMLEDKNKYFLLDVRTKEEYSSGFLENSILIPVTELENRLSEIPSGKPVIIYCRSGNRSSQAAAILLKNNYNPVYNMLGGITEWEKKGYPVVK